MASRTLGLDVLSALRMWRRYPTSTAIAIVALALGIGATATVFSVVSGVLLRPLPYHDPGRLVALWQDRSATGGPAREVFSPGLAVDWMRRAAPVDGVTAYQTWSPALTAPDQEAERLTGAAVSGAHFITLGVPPALGRTFESNDDVPGGAPVVVMSDRLWRRRFAADPGIIGRTITLDGIATTVVGVMPPAFRGVGIDADVWGPLRIDPANAPRGIVMLRAFARLRPGVTLDAAQWAMSTLQHQIRADDRELEGAEARVVPLHDDLVGPARPLLLVLAAAVALVLGIACANVASLLMARATERHGELAVRAALGASRSRLVALLLVDAAVLALAGGLAGTAMAVVGVRALVALAPPTSARLQDVTLDGGVLLFAAAVTAVAALAAGAAPAVVASRTAFGRGLGATGRTAGGFTRARAALVVAEVAVAIMLASGAGLFLQSLIRLQRVDLGFRPEGLLTASATPARGTYPDPDALRDLYGQLRARTAAVPGVRDAALTSMLPLSGGQIIFNFRIPGRPPARSSADAPVAAFRAVSDNFFDVMGMRIREGRGFTAADRAGGDPVVVVNETLVRRYWSGRSPVGTRIRLNGNEATIVGIVGDVRHEGPASVPDGELFAPMAQLPPRQAWLVVRAHGDPAALGASVRSAVRDVAPTMPLARIRPMTALVSDQVADTRFLAALLGGFSSVAVALALAGIYGLLAFTVSRRTREIGVRLALGASRASVLGLVLRDSVMVVGAGLVLGLAGTLVLGRLVRTLLFSITPGEPRTLAVVAFLVLVATVAASIIPARRAAGIAPSSALREP